MNERLKPAFWGGLFIGVLSALPLVNLGNCCCCLWVLAGGALTVYLRQQTTPMEIPAAEGALMGLMAGAIGGVLATVIGLPLQMLTSGFNQQLMDRVLSSNPDMPPELRELFANTATGAVAGVMMLVINVVVMTIFGMLGGLLGVAIFKKTPPPPPPGTVEVLPPA
jgi:ribose/xylose/arabinose/galactoside ABC-type transport system permease subunit